MKKAYEHNYQMLSLRKYAEEDYDNAKKVLILRHDIGHISLGTWAMFKAEKSMEQMSVIIFGGQQLNIC